MPKAAAAVATAAKKKSAPPPATPELAAEWVAPATLKPWAKNPRKNDGEPVNKVAESIKRFGFAAPIVARKATREIIAGHTRWKAATKLGLDRVPVRFLDISEREAHLLALADNRLGEIADWDDSALHEILASYDMGDQLMAGWNEKDLRELELAIRTDDEVTEDAVPEPPKHPVTKPGDVWVMGKHRLVCGDCRDATVVALAVDGAAVAVAFTSPPYASQRDYDEKSGFKPIPSEVYVDWFDAVQAGVRNVLASDGSWFVNIKPHVDGLDTNLYVFDLVTAHVRRWGWHFATEFCWERSGVPKNVRQRFKNQFEPVYQFARNRWKMRPEAVMHSSSSVPIAGGEGIGNTSWGNERQGQRAFFAGGSKPGLAYPGNRLPTFGAADATGHTAAFPVGLPGFFVRAYSDVGDVIMDPFCGSGSTIIAAHKLDRVGVGIELSPAYCDVIVERWQKLTGGKAQRANSAAPIAKPRRKSA